MNELLLLLADIELFGSEFFDKRFFELLVKAVFNFNYWLHCSLFVLSGYKKIKITFSLICLSVLLCFSFVFF